MLVPGLRPEQYLMALESDYRGIGDWYDRFFKEPNREAWPAWCYCPMDEAYDWARLRGLEGDTKEAARVGALTAWRATKGIYPMDLERLDRVMREPSPELSADWVTQLPEWCVYMEFQDCHVVVDVGRGESRWLMGVFAWLSLGVGGEPELWLLADTDVGLVAPEIVSTAATAEPPEPGSLASFVVKVLRHLCSAPRRKSLP